MSNLIAAAVVAGGAQRGSDGQLTLPAHRARQKEVRDVCARDEQHEGDGGQQDHHRSADVADDLIEQWHDREREPAVRRIEVRMVAAEARRQRIHFRLRLLNSDTRLELADDVVVLARPRRRCRRRQWQRQENLAVLRNAKGRHHFARQPERFGQDTGDLIALSVEDDRLADDRDVAAEPPRPEAVTEDRGSGTPRRIVFRHEELAAERTSAEHRKQVRRDPNDTDAFGIAAAGQVEVRANGNGEFLESLMAVPDVEVLRG